MEPACESVVPIDLGLASSDAGDDKDPKKVKGASKEPFVASSKGPKD